MMTETIGVPVSAKVRLRLSARPEISLAVVALFAMAFPRGAHSRQPASSTRGTQATDPGALLAKRTQSGYMPSFMKATCYCAAVRTAARKTTALYDSIL